LIHQAKYLGHRTFHPIFTVTQQQTHPHTHTHTHTHKNTEWTDCSAWSVVSKNKQNVTCSLTLYVNNCKSVIHIHNQFLFNQSSFLEFDPV